MLAAETIVRRLSLEKISQVAASSNRPPYKVVVLKIRTDQLLIKLLKVVEAPTIITCRTTLTILDATAVTVLSRTCLSTILRTQFQS